MSINKIAKVMLITLMLAGCSSPAPSHSVTYNANGGAFESGSDVYSVVVEGDNKESLDEVIPTKEGYTFEGWYTDEALTEAFDGNTENTDVTLYAKWTPIEYAVSFVSADGEKIDETVVKYGDSIKAPETAPEKDGYTFNGWYEDEAGEKEFDFSAPILSDTTIHAVYTKSVINLTELPSFVFQSQVRDPYVWMGCEAASLLMALKTTGNALDMPYTQFLNELPKTDSDNPYLGFCGDLYSDTWTRDAVMPNIVTEWGAQYGNTKDLTKQGLDAVIEALEKGHPVVVWTSSHMVPSETVWDDTKTGLTDDATDPITGEVLNYFGSTGSHWEYKTHNHVMTLMGYNSETREFLLADPAEWLGPTYWVTYDTFMNSWNCYQGAVEVW